MCKLKISKPSGETSGGRSDKPRRMGVSGKGDAGRASNVWQSDGEPGDVWAPSPTPQQHQQATTRASAPLLEQVEMMPHSPVRPTGAKQKRKTTDKGDQAPMPRSGESSVRGQALHSHSPADNRSSTTKSREPSPLVDKSSVVPASAGKMTCAACGRATSIETSVGKIVHNTNNTSRFKFFKGKYKTSWNLQNTTNHPRYCLRDDCCYEAWCVYTGETKRGVTAIAASSGSSSSSSTAAGVPPVVYPPPPYIPIMTPLPSGLGQSSSSDTGLTCALCNRGFYHAKSARHLPAMDYTELSDSLLGFVPSCRLSIPFRRFLESGSGPVDSLVPSSGKVHRTCRKVMEEGGNFVSIGGSKKSITFPATPEPPPPPGVGGGGGGGGGGVRAVGAAGGVEEGNEEKEGEREREGGEREEGGGVSLGAREELGGGRTEADQLPRRTASMLLERLVNESTEAWFSRSLAAALLAGADAADMEGKEDTDDERTRVEEVPEEAEVDSDDFSSVEPDFHGEGDRHPRRKVVDEEWEMHEQELEMGEALDEESVYDDGDDALNDMMEDEDPPDDYSSDDDDDPKSDFGDD